MAVLERGFGLFSIRPTGAFGGYKKWLRGDWTYADALARTTMAGIYKLNRYGTKKVYVQMPFYCPTNPRTAPQQARRIVFRNGVVDWHALTDDERWMYNKRARSLGISGFNLHQREWLAAH